MLHMQLIFSQQTNNLFFSDVVLIPPSWSHEQKASFNHDKRISQLWRWKTRLLPGFSPPGINKTINYTITIFSVMFLYSCVLLFISISLMGIINLDENLHESTPLRHVLLCLLQDVRPGRLHFCQPLQSHFWPGGGRRRTPPGSCPSVYFLWACCEANTLAKNIISHATTLFICSWTWSASNLWLSIHL